MIKINSDKNKSILKLVGVIIGVAVVLLILYFLGKNNLKDNFSQSDLQIIPKNNISTQVQNYTFKLDAKNLPTQANVYQYGSFENIYLNNLITNLFLKEDTSSEITGAKTYSDSTGSSLTYYQQQSIISFSNVASSALTNFNRENALSVFGNITGYDFSNYYIVNVEDKGDGNITLIYGLKIDGTTLTTDFNIPTFLTFYIGANTLVRFDWKYVKPIVVSKLNLITLDYIRQNINTIKKGLYPLTDPGVNEERIANYEDFKGDIEVNEVELNYLSTVDSKLINPVYKFKCKFINTEKRVFEGTMIVPAASL